MNTLLTGRVEAVQRKALNVVDWRFRSPTSSEHPYRSFATSMRRAFPPLPLLLLTLFSFRRFATAVTNVAQASSSFVLPPRLCKFRSEGKLKDILRPGSSPSP